MCANRAPPPHKMRSSGTWLDYQDFDMIGINALRTVTFEGDSPFLQSGSVPLMTSPENRGGATRSQAEVNACPSAWRESIERRWA